MKQIFVVMAILSGFLQGFSQEVLHTTNRILALKINNQPVERWDIAPEINPDILEVECTQKKNLVYVSGGKNILKFVIKKGQKADFKVQTDAGETAHIRLVGVAPNVRFTKKYIKENRGKVAVQIPEVSELVNILMILHQYAERDRNMFDIDSDYYKRVKEYFAPYRNHPAIDTIQKYITRPRLNRDQQVYLFPMESYNYYYALKMNSVDYEFDKNGRIKKKGLIDQVGKSWGGDVRPNERCGRI